MNYITTTQLRTKSSEMIETLLSGHKIDLIHRSRVVGEIRPKAIYIPKRVSASSLMKKIDKLNFPRLTLDEIDRRYKIAMKKKHGKGLS